MVQFFKKKWEEIAPHIWSMIKQLLVPAILAVGYGVWDWHSSGGDFELSEYLKIVMPALFFLMWFVGLYERQKKRSSDSQSFNTLDQKLESLSEAVNKLSPKHSQPTATATPSATTSATFSQEMMAEAENVFKSGHHLAALLQAGVAFEQAVRSYAKASKLEEADRMSLLHILKKIDFLLPKGVEGELHALRQVRNQLAHASENELRHLDQAERILSAYRWAIETLENEAHNKELRRTSR